MAKVLPLDLQELEEILAKISQLNEIKKSLQEKPSLTSAPIEIISRAIEIANANTRDELLNLSPRELFSEFEHKSEALNRLISAIDGLTGAVKVLDFDTSLEVKALEAVSISIVVVAKLEPQHRPWLGRFREKNIQLFEAAKNRWTPLVESERAWRARCAIGEVLGLHQKKSNVLLTYSERAKLESYSPKSEDPKKQRSKLLVVFGSIRIYRQQATISDS